LEPRLSLPVDSPQGRYEYLSPGLRLDFGKSYLNALALGAAFAANDVPFGYFAARAASSGLSQPLRLGRRLPVDLRSAHEARPF
jgi:hypothetical protein